jgi:hypothetical protein
VRWLVYLPPIIKSNNYCQSQFFFIEAASIAHAVSRWSFTAETRVRSQAGPFGIFCGKLGTSTGSVGIIDFHYRSTNDPFFYHEGCITSPTNIVVKLIRRESWGFSERRRRRLCLRVAG